MNAAAWISLCGVLVTLLITGGGYLVVWGRHINSVRALAERVDKLEREGSVSALAARVADLEGEMTALVNGLNELKVANARVETKLDGMTEQLKDLNASIRWMREPPPYEPQAIPGVTRPTRKP